MMSNDHNYFSHGFHHNKFIILQKEALSLTETVQQVSEILPNVSFCSFTEHVSNNNTSVTETPYLHYDHCSALGL